MARTLPLHRMVPSAPLEGSALTEAPVTPSEISQCIREAMGSQGGSMGASPDYVFLVLGCPLMRSGPSFIKFVSSRISHLPFLSVLLTLTNSTWDDASRGTLC